MKLQQQSAIIKVQYKNSVFNLGKNIHTYQELLEKINSRFPLLKNSSLIFNQKELTAQTFQKELKQLVSKGQKSLKLELRQLGQTNSKKTEGKLFSFDPNEFENELQSHDNSQKHKQLQPIDLSKINIKVEIEENALNVTIQEGIEYFWICTLFNESQVNVPEQIYVRDLTTHKLIQIKGLEKGQAKEIQFGPYVQKQAGKHVHFYQIIYKKNEQIRYPIGSKFGFVCNAEKKIATKQMQNKVSERVNHLKSFSACQKSAQNIMMNLKEMGIGQGQIEQYEDHDLIQIFESFNV